jgi:hypothetical protein
MPKKPTTKKSAPRKTVAQKNSDLLNQTVAGNRQSTNPLPSNTTRRGSNNDPFGINMNIGLFDSIFDNIGEYDDEKKEMIEAAIRAYQRVGVIKNVTDLQADFASEGFELNHKVASVQRFFRSWANKVDLDERVNAILTEYFKHGNVIVLKTPGKISKKEEKRFKSIAKRDLVLNYTILNPLRCSFDVEGNLIYEISRDADISTGEFSGFKTVDNPKQVDSTRTRKIHINKQEAEKKFILIPKDRFSTVFNKKVDGESWAIPSTWPVLEDVDYKRRMRRMDIAAADGVIKAVKVWKLGNLKEGYIADKAAYEKLDALLAAPTRNLDLIWNDGIDMKVDWPPVGDILGKEKYEAIDDDILAGLGISAVMVNGRGGNYANSFLSVKTMLKKVERGRKMVMRFLMEDIEAMVNSFGFKSMPHISFDNMSLRDEEAEKRLLIQLMDRGVLSNETVLEAWNENSQIESSRISKQKIEPMGPYVREEESTSTDDSAHDAPVGRPNDINTPHEVQRDTKPTGASEKNINKSKIYDMYKTTESFITDVYISAKNVKYKKSLKKEEKESLDSLIFTVFSQMPISASEGTQDNINKLCISIMENNLNLDLKMLQIKDKKIEAFINKNNKQPLKKDVTDIIVESFIERKK